MKDPYYSNRLKKSRALRKKTRRMRPLSEEIEATSKLLITTIGGLVLITTIGFLYVSSLQAAKGYHLRQLQIDHEQLLIKNRALQRDVNEALSIINIDETEVVQNMKEPNESEARYIETGNEFAAR